MKRFIKVEQLAKELDQFVYDMDPYGYRDQFDSRKEGMQSTISDLMLGKTDIITQKLQTMIQENPAPESVERAKMFIGQLKDHSLTSRLFISVLNYKDNVDKLSDFPYVQKGQFAIVSQLAIGDKNEFDEYTSYLTVTHTMCENWNMDIDKLFQMAVENSKLLYPGEIKEIDYYTAKENMGGEILLKSDGTVVPKTYVLTNKAHFNGSGTLFYQPELLRELAEKMDTEQLALIPTGNNEIYVIVMGQEDDIAELKELKQAVDNELSGKSISECIMTYHADTGMVEEYGGESYFLNVAEENEKEQNLMDEDITYNFNRR